MGEPESFEISEGREGLTDGFGFGVVFSLLVRVRSGLEREEKAGKEHTGSSEGRCPV